MTLPNFLIVGAAKSGTTALHMILNEHPQIFMSTTKELHYFSYPETSKLTQGPDTFKRVAVSSLAEYETYFDAVQNELAVGEASPSYLYFPVCAERIKSLIPKTKIIAILRNPVERAYSSYLHAIRDGWENVGFKEALQLESDRIKAGWDIVWHYQAAGFYADRVRAYQTLFDADQLQICLYDDLVRRPAVLIRELFTFLEVDPEFVPHYNLRPNVSGVAKSAMAAKLMKDLFDKPNIIRDLSRKFISPSIRWRFTNALRNRNLSKPRMDYEVRNQLKALFREDILNLQGLIHRDLTAWLTDTSEDYA